MDLDFGWVEIKLDAVLPLIPAGPDDFLLKYNVTATYPVDQKSKSISTITIAYAGIVPLPPTSDQGYLSEVCEAYGQDIWELYQTLYDEEDRLFRPPLDSMKHQEVWYLERFFVDAEFQNKGLGSTVLNWIKDFLCRRRGAIIVLPKPLRVKNRRDGGFFIDVTEKYPPALKERLVRFYARQGFSKLEGTPYLCRVIE